MDNRSTFGNAALAQKMASRFGAEPRTVQVRMRYAREVRKFIDKVEDAHRKAGNSKLVFR